MAFSLLAAGMPHAFAAKPMQARGHRSKLRVFSEADGVINLGVQKDSPKVVDTIPTSAIDKQVTDIACTSFATPIQIKRNSII